MELQACTWQSWVCVWPPTLLTRRLFQAAVSWLKEKLHWARFTLEFPAAVHCKPLLTPLLYWLCSPVIYLSAVYTAGAAAVVEPDGDKYLTLQVHTVYWGLLNIGAQILHIQGSNVFSEPAFSRSSCCSRCPTSASWSWFRCVSESACRAGCAAVVWEWLQKHLRTRNVSTITRMFTVLEKSNHNDQIFSIMKIDYPYFFSFIL